MKKIKARPIEFSCHAPSAKEVFVAGTFNDWKADAAPLRQQNGDWTATLFLSPGRYEYKFVVDGQWCCEPGCEQEYRGCPKCVPNELGTMNRVLEVSEEGASV
jgi:5'-AMP-activated protein kinase regulatory beta subunit